MLSGPGFKTDGRKKYESDEEDIDIDIDIKPDEFELNNTFEELKVDDTSKLKSNSNQWRLQHPNNSSDRPCGMAPIIPHMDPYDPIERPREYSAFKHFRNRSNNNNSYNNDNNNSYNNNNNRRNNNNNFNRRNNNNYNNYNQNNNFNRNNNNNHINRNNRRPNNNMQRNDNFIKDQVRNICFNRNPSNNNDNFTVTSQLSLTSPSAQLAEAQNLISKNNVTKDDMGNIASVMMAILRGQGPEQKYDMDVQKQIHNIQVSFFIIVFNTKFLSTKI